MEQIKVNYCGRKRQERLIARGWQVVVPKDYHETPEQLYQRLTDAGYSKVKVYWEGTMIRGIHSYFAMVKD